MKLQRRAIMTHLTFISFLVFFSTAKGFCFDPQAVSQVSKGIAEWKTMNTGTAEPQNKQTVYVSSSLTGMVRNSGSEESGIIVGLAAFDHNSSMESEIRQWEWNARASAAIGTISSLADQSNTIAKTMYTLSSETAKHGTGFYVAEKYGQIGSKIFTSGTVIFGAAGKAADLFISTVSYVATSMQGMNPDIYLVHDPNAGRFASFKPIKPALVPTAGTWTGNGSYHTRDGFVSYEHTLEISETGAISRTHVDQGTSKKETYYRKVEEKTAPVGLLDRILIARNPHSALSPLTRTTTIQKTIRESTFPIGVQYGTRGPAPLPAFGPGAHIYAAPPTFNATWKTAQIGSSTFKYPLIDWSSMSSGNYSNSSTKR